MKEERNEGQTDKTRPFETVKGPNTDSGHLFPADAGQSPGQEPKRGKQVLSALGKTGKYSGKTVLFLLRKIVTYTLSLLFTVIIVGILVGAAVGLTFMVYLRSYVDAECPELDNLKFDSSLTTSLYVVDSSGKEVELEADRLSSSENRLWVPYSEIPKTLIEAYVAIEDQRFWEHNGVDTKRTLSAIYNFFIPSGSQYGGSTLTQQLIKNVTGEDDTTIQRKVQEIFRALNVEKKYDKTEIIEMYLNTIYLSENCYGVRAAAEEYFGKELSALTLNECAALASIGKSPVKYDPLINPQYNLERRNLVLREMLRQGKITQAEFDEAYDAPLVLANDEDYEYTETVHSYYIDAVIDDVISDLMQQYGYDEKTASLKLYSGGLQVITCMDPTIQSILETVYCDESYWASTTGIQAQSAMCVMDPVTGNLLGIVGGRGEKKVSRGLNRATHSKRQCGSSVKPVSVYAYALDSGLYNYAGPCDDVPVLYDEARDALWPNNANRVFSGRSSLENAIQRSLNTTATKTCELLGIQNVYNNMLRSGFTTLVDHYVSPSGKVFSDAALSPLTHGAFTFGVTVREMTQAYATFANGGVTSKARTYSVVRDAKGNVILNNAEQHDVLYAESTAYMLTRLLETVITGSAGTARRYIDFHRDFDVEVAAKTGTTNDNKDLYFCGYTPDLVAACWYGYDNNKTITAGGGACAQLWNSVFRLIYESWQQNGVRYTHTFEQPNTVTSAKDTGIRICTVSGKLATEACERDIGYVMGETGSCVTTNFYYLKSNPPTETCDKHIAVEWDRTTQAICMPECSCPEANRITVGFRLLEKSERTFRKNVRITDAQYIYIRVPGNYTYPTSDKVPFFWNLYGENEYPGYTSSSSKPYNRVCTEHLHTSPMVPFDPTA